MRPAPGAPLRHALGAVVTLAGLALAMVPSDRLAAAEEPLRQPDRLVVVSTTDLKGKTSPCGCHTPKGGFARRASLVDSLAREYSQVVSVDAGGWFPEGTDDFREVAAFMAAELGRSGMAGVGVSERELRYGLGFLRAVVAEGRTPVLCGNLVDRTTGKLVFPESRLVKVGRVTVGVFGVLSSHADLGPSADSLQLTDPIAAAYRAIRSLRRRGATVVIGLASMGKVDAEELAQTLDSIDVLVPSGDIPLQEGRNVHGAIVAYGGEQGHYADITRLELGPDGHARHGDNDPFMLGPWVSEQREVFQRVQAFEDAFNEHERVRQAARAAAAAEAAGEPDDPPSHYVGAEVCGRCHPSELAQWHTTAHARAWKTLVDLKKDATPECVSCHVVGYQQPGGFATGADAAKLANVQCESCHGMGTEHESWPAERRAVPEAVCRGCHTEISSPVFDFKLYRPHILHQVPAEMPALPPKPKVAGMSAK